MEPLRPAAALSRPALLLLCLAGLAGCTRVAPAGLPAGTTLDDLPEAETWGARLRTSEAGRPAVEVDAPYLARFARAPASAGLDLTLPDGGVDSAAVFLGPPPDGSAAGRVAVRLFGADGSPSATVSAGRAWLHEASGRLVAEGSVEATGGGARVSADRLTTSRDGAFTAAGTVRATIGDASVSAGRLTSAPGGAFTASGGARATIGGRAQATVRAQTLSGAPGGARYTASGNAHVDAQGGRRLDAATIVWNEAAGRFRAPGAFSFDGPGERVRGVDLDATADLSRYSFRRATGQIEVRE